MGDTTTTSASLLRFSAHPHRRGESLTIPLSGPGPQTRVRPSLSFFLCLFAFPSWLSCPRSPENYSQNNMHRNVETWALTSHIISWECHKILDNTWNYHVVYFTQSALSNVSIYQRGCLIWLIQLNRKLFTQIFTRPLQIWK